MSRVNELIEKMVKSQIERVVLSSDAPMQVFGAGGERQTTVISFDQLAIIFNEVMGADWRTKLTVGTGRHIFHSSPHGEFTLFVKRYRNQADVEKLELEVNSRISDDLRQTMDDVFANLSQPSSFKPSPSASRSPVQQPKTSPQVPRTPTASVPATTQTPHTAKAGNDSGNGAASVLPDELKGWNGGGGFLVGFWCIAHKAWVDLAMWSLGPALFLITYALTREFIIALGALSLFGGPIILYMLLRFGHTANQTAWQNRKWDSISHFKEVQKEWARCARFVTFGTIPLFFLYSVLEALILIPLGVSYGPFWMILASILAIASSGLLAKTLNIKR